MAEDEPKKKGKKVEVDDEFLKEVLRNQTELKKELDTLKNAPQSGSQGPIKLEFNAPQIMFSCEALSTIKEQSDFNKVFPDFQKELDVLMKKYHMVKVVAHMYTNSI